MRFLLPILLFLVLATPASAFVSSPPVVFGEGRAFRHLYEVDDFFVVMRYDLPTSGTSPIWGADITVTPNTDYQNSDAYFEVADASGVIVETLHPPSIGAALVGIYMSAATFAASSIVWNDGSTVELYSSPMLFAPIETTGPQTFVWTTTTANTVEAGEAAFVSNIVPIMRNLESSADEFDTGELVSGGDLTQLGADILTAAFPQLISTPFTAMGGAEIQILETVFSPGTDQLQVDISAGGFAFGTTVRNLGAGFGVGNAGGMFLVLFFLSGVAIFALYTLTKDIQISLTAIPILIVALTRTDAMYTAFMFVVAMILLIAFAAWVWSARSA